MEKLLIVLIALEALGRVGIKLKENGTFRDSDTANPTNAKISEHTDVEVTVG
ncbi:hypothetical protein [Virgibacillus sp. JSM 102003]|uniref:hypothetical protein n=1 Tax=Virgibacillus sp. JSM 102003 TaxID=1562108 RepID=UPI0035C2002B